MEKFSVKKPFTVLVAVIMVLMLGFVSITKMKTNLLPNVSTPYLMVVTVYPGASPERVETEVSDVLQNALTVPGVSKITATSAENYSLLLMQFVDDTDMDSALVQVSNKLDQAKSDLPETVLTPSVIQYSMNMNAFMTVAVSREGSSVYDLSDFIKNTMTPYVQRKGGVQRILQRPCGAAGAGAAESGKGGRHQRKADGAYRHSAGSGAHTVGGGRGQDQGRPRRIR